MLKPGGRLLFIKHVRADDERLARWQDRLDGLQTRFGHGCNCNRRTIETITAAGFEITQLARDVLRKASPIVRPLVIGVAQTNDRPGRPSGSPEPRPPRFWVGTNRATPACAPE